MPLSKIQQRVLSLIAANRTPESFVAGGAVLQERGFRFSKDLDLFHDPGRSVAAAAQTDVDVLLSSGLSVTWIRRSGTMHSASVYDATGSTDIDWVQDSDFRFFPAVPDPVFGYRLHPADLATNKALAAAGRKAARDIIDLLYVHERILPLGAVVWAAVAKDQGFSPESCLDWIGRNARYQQYDFDELDSTEPLDAGDVSRRLREARQEAEAFAEAMPGGKEGLLFLRNGVPVQPDPYDLSDVVEHAGQRGGHWPSSSEIGGAMLRDQE